MPGGRGRKKVKALDILDGNPGKRMIEDYGIEAQSEPYIGEHLIDDARGVIEIIKASMPRRVYSALDSQLLAAFGMAAAVHKMASAKFGEPGFELINKRGHVSRWFHVLNTATDKMLALSSKLGLDPVTRQGMKIPGTRQQRSKFADLSGETHAAPIGSSAMSNFSESPAARVKAGRSN